MDLKQIREIIQHNVEVAKTPEQLADEAYERETRAIANSPRAKTLEEMGEFKFAEGRDASGLPHEHKSYVKRSCNQCYGRGYVIQSRDGRHYQVCGCVHRGYERVRKELDRKGASWRRNRVKHNLTKPEGEPELDVTDRALNEYLKTCTTDLGL